jgi:hypothetical protein
MEADNSEAFVPELFQFLYAWEWERPQHSCSPLILRRCALPLKNEGTGC